MSKDREGVDTSAAAIATHLADHAEHRASPHYEDSAGISTRVGWHRRNDALMRAIVAERDDQRQACEIALSSSRGMEADRDRLAAENARLRGREVDLTSLRTGLLSAGISERTVDNMLSSPAFSRERAALTPEPGHD